MRDLDIFPTVTGFTCSAFDLLHAGHILMLEEAKTQCDKLIVGLQNDPSFDRASKNKPIQSLVERYVQLKGVKYIDEIIVYNTEKDLEDLLKILDINVRFVGEEYKDKTLTGRDICTARNISIYYNKRQHSFSTTELRTRIANIETQRQIPINTTKGFNGTSGMLVDQELTGGVLLVGGATWGEP